MKEPLLSLAISASNLIGITLTLQAWQSSEAALPLSSDACGKKMLSNSATIR